MKNKSAFCFTLSKEAADYIKSKSKETGIKMSTLVDKAILAYKNTLP